MKESPHMCLVCGNNVNVPMQFNQHPISADCPRCGIFFFELEAGRQYLKEESQFGPYGSRQRANLSGYLRENQGFTIRADDCERLKNIKTPSFNDRADRLLQFIGNRTQFAGERISLADNECLGFSWALNNDELLEIYSYLSETKRIEDSQEVPTSFQVVHDAKILPDGWAHLEKLNAINPDSKQGFVAMWFSEEVKSAEGAIRKAVSEAGFNAHLVKDREHVGQITDEIIAQIRRSRFLVADFTGHRGGVYYEAGFAHGLGLPVFFCCNKKHMDERHFDIYAYNFIVWENEEELIERLKNRIMSVFSK